jgi:two-component system, chemotaxis family, chemotaxis protein CheY
MGATVLIVDDSAFMRNMLKNIISQSGATVVGEGADGQEAIDKVKELNPQIVFLDIMMPNVNGLEALKQIKVNNPNVKVVMCTSAGQDKIISEAVEAGASEFVKKPFKPDEINQIISKLS